MIELKIDVTDWANEYTQEEPDLSSEDAMLMTHQEHDFSTKKIGRLAIIARERGDAPDDILPSNKTLLERGAGRDVNTIFTSLEKRMTMPNGQEFTVRATVGPVSKKAVENADAEYTVETLGDTTWVDCDTPEALRRAQSYLNRIVPGHIWNRLTIIALNGGDVTAAGKELQDKIDELVARLS